MNELERLREILAQTEAVRVEQKAFFGGDRSRERVASAKRAESRLDKMIAKHRATLTEERQGTLIP